MLRWKLRFIKYLEMLLILACLVASCSHTNRQQEYSIPSPTSRESIIPSLTPTDFVSKAAIPTNTPNKPTFTPGPNIQSTLEASKLDHVEELSNNEMTSLLELNFETEDPSCSLPCWNGITPGNSNILDLPEFYGRLGFKQFKIVEYDTDRVAWAVSDDLNRAQWGRDYYLEIGAQWIEGSDEVSVIRLITLSSPKGFDLGMLLRKLGFPEIVLMDEIGQGTGIQMLLAYPQRGISITLLVDVDNSGTMLCVKYPFIEAIYLVFADPTIDVIEESIPMDYPNDPSYYTSMDEERMFKFVLQSKCIPLTWASN